MTGTRCRLCGEPAHGAYCHAHDWALGAEIRPDEVEITDLHDYWMRRYTPDEVSDLAAYLQEAV